MLTVLAPPPPSLSVRASLPRRPQSKKQQQQQKRTWGDFSHFAQVVRKDVEFLKKGIDNGVAWANHTFRIPQVAKKIDDVVWLRHLEDPHSPPFPSPSWPQPWYPGLRPHPQFHLNFALLIHRVAIVDVFNDIARKFLSQPC